MHDLKIKGGIYFLKIQKSNWKKKKKEQQSAKLKSTARGQGQHLKWGADDEAAPGVR